MSWRHEKYDSHWQQQAHAIEDHLQFLYALNETLTSAGCDKTVMEERARWLVEQLAELHMFRQTQDGSLTDTIGRFHEILKREVRLTPDDPKLVLQFALDELRRFAALQEHMRETRIYVNYETVYPDEGDGE